MGNIGAFITLLCTNNFETSEQILKLNYKAFFPLVVLHCELEDRNSELMSKVCMIENWVSYLVH